MGTTIDFIEKVSKVPEVLLICALLFERMYYEVNVDKSLSDKDRVGWFKASYLAAGHYPGSPQKKVVVVQERKRRQPPVVKRVQPKPGKKLVIKVQAKKPGVVKVAPAPKLKSGHRVMSKLNPELHEHDRRPVPEQSGWDDDFRFADYLCDKIR
jgi:hypothetical protein